MASTNFVNNTTLIVADWLNDVDAVTYTTVPANTAAIATKAAAGANADITSLSAISTPLSVVQGGTGGNSAVTARTSLGCAASGPISTSDLTQSTSKLLGRTTAGTGAVEEISVGSGLSLSAGTLSATALTPAQIQPISASVGSSALTISASSLSLDFRSSTLGSGTVTTVTGTPADLVISSGSTLGTVSGMWSRLIVLAINNAGTIELAVTNSSYSTPLDENALISTTAEGGAGAADSAQVIYSTTARSNVAYRIIGYIESTQATAGTWATAPSLIQGAGGQALKHVSSLVRGVPTATTSGTSIDYTDIPSWVRRITISFAGVSTSGSNPVRLQIGGGSVETTGYESTSTVMGVANGTSTSGFDRYQNSAGDITSGTYVLTHLGSNLWVCAAQYALNTASNPGWITGNKTTAAALDRVRLTTVGGTDTFDAGTVNIFYE